MRAQQISSISPQHPFRSQSPELVLIDTDIGDDLDDAFAVALALQSPELRILGITTTYGDTDLRARLLGRFLAAVSRQEIPVAAGPATPSKGVFTQRRYAEQAPSSPDKRQTAIDLFAEQVRAHPHAITLVAIGPLTTVEALIDREPALFRQLKRVVMMGGSIDRGYGLPYSAAPHGPDAEWNILNGISGARKLLASGVPIVMLPLDATQLPLDEVKRAALFAHGSPLTDQLTLLYQQYGQQTPTLFDPLTIATLLDPRVCPTEPMRLRVDDQGYTRREPGPANVQVCLRSDADAFYTLLMTRLLSPPPAP